MPDKISEKTVMSLHIVCILIGLTVWVVRLADIVEHNEKKLLELQELQKKEYAKRLDDSIDILILKQKLHIKTDKE